MACGEKFALPDLPLAPYHPSDTFVNYFEKNRIWRPFFHYEEAKDLVYCIFAPQLLGSSAEPSC